MPPITLAQTVEPGAASLVAVLLLLAMMAAFAFWGALFQRRRAAEPILPKEPRALVPWQGGDVLAVLAMHIVLSTLAVGLVHWLLGPELTEALPVADGKTPDSAHAVLKALAAGGPWVLLLCVVAAVVVAPVAEEFLFRVVLQGWLESCVERFAGFFPGLRRVLPGEWGPVLLSSLLFAAVHFRTAGPERHGEFLIGLLLANAVVWLLSVGCAVVWLRFRAGATAADLGLVTGKMADDTRLGLWSLVGVLGPIYAVQIACHFALPKHIAPDPIPLFFLAVALGVLYARTHRLVPCIVLHAGLNAASLAMAWMTLAKL